MPSIGIEAVLVGLVPQLAPELVGRQLGVLLEDVVGDLLHEPVERLALQTLFHRKLEKQTGFDILNSV